jgi:hypothetical protein
MEYATYATRIPDDVLPRLSALCGGSMTPR